MDDIISKIKISPKVSIKEALKKIDEVGRRILFVCDEDDRLIGSLTDGDIRRRILKTGDINETIEHCFNNNPIFLEKGKYSEGHLEALMSKNTIDAIPIVDKSRNITELLFWKDIFKDGSTFCEKKINSTVVIMAGGKGERMGPFTKILPKPLIPVGEKPVIEIIMDKFNKYGVTHFYVILNYKGEMIRNYFDSIDKNYKIDYIQEKEFLGTAGGIRLLPQDIQNNFIVTNCDIIVNTDYADLLDFHQENNNILTAIGSIQHHRISCGLIHFEKNGKIKDIQEKPEFDLTVNTGVYVLSRRAISFIPPNVYFDMTELIQLLLGKNENVGVYPVSQKSYIEIGQWEEYKKVIEKLQLFT